MPILTAWGDPGCPIPVDYSREALEQIRSLAIDGLLALPRIGLGVGGLLLGIREADKTTILDSLTIPCSHAEGPSFYLTPEEQKNALELAGSAHPLIVVGWYCSKTRGLVAMNERDLSLFGILCPEAWQVTLLIRPGTVETSRTALCFRDAAGVVVRGKEIPLESFQPALPELGTEPAVDEPRKTIETNEPVAAHSVASPALVSPILSSPQSVGSPVVDPPVATVSSGKPVVPPIATPPAEIPLAVTAPPEVPPPAPLFQFAMPPAARPRSRMGLVRWVLLAFALVAGMCAAFFTRHDWMPLPPLRLSASDAGGRLTIRWNRDALPGIDRATLTLNDGGEPHTIVLDSRQLDAGTVKYERKSAHVDALLQAGDLKAQVSYPE